MSILNYYVIVVTGQKDAVDAAHKRAVAEFGKQVTSIASAPFADGGGEYTFCIGPDNAKDSSSYGIDSEEKRRAFKLFLH